MIKRLLITAVSLLLLVTSVTPSALAAPAAQGSTGTQIVLMMGDPKLKFTSVSISGSNQNHKWTTWSTQDKNGFTTAYTKNWWWIQDFVQIDFTIRDSQGKQTSKHCLIDALAQPPANNFPATVIVYDSKKGCVGGDAGSAQDINSVKQLKAISYYIPPDNLIRLLYNEANVAACFAGVSATVSTFGLSYSNAITAGFITKSCWTTSEMILKYFTQP